MTETIATVTMGGTALAAAYIVLKVCIFLLRTVEALAKPALAGAVTFGLGYVAAVVCTMPISGWEYLLAGSLVLATLGGLGYTSKYMRQAVKAIDQAWQDLWEL